MGNGGKEGRGLIVHLVWQPMGASCRKHSERNRQTDRDPERRNMIGKHAHLFTEGRLKIRRIYREDCRGGGGEDGTCLGERAGKATGGEDLSGHEILYKGSVTGVKLCFRGRKKIFGWGLGRTQNE